MDRIVIVVFYIVVQDFEETRFIYLFVPGKAFGRMPISAAILRVTTNGEIFVESRKTVKF